MTAAEERARQANAAAAARIDAISGQLAAMGGAAAAPGDGRLPPDEILRRYQTADDSGGMWPTLISDREITASELALLNAVGIFGAKDAYDIEEEAAARAKRAFDGAGLQHGHADAFRHAYWNALLTQRFGERWARDFTTAHEGSPGNNETSEAMDLYNNEAGRRVALEHPDASPEGLAGLVERAVTGGSTVVIAPSSQLAYSDQLRPGTTITTEPRPDNRPGTPPAEPDTSYGPGGYQPGSAPGDDTTYQRDGP